MKCHKCGEQFYLPFKCPYCKDYFCTEHRLPENHDCPRIEIARAPRRETRPTILQKPYEYTVTSTQQKPSKKIHFSNTEAIHLGTATLLIIAIGFSQVLYETMEPIFLILSTTLLTTSFLIHEMAHKIAAVKGGFLAEFRLILTGAVLTLISAISPFFKIISPGAVMVSGFVDRKSMGRISIAGPVTNIILSTVFLTAAFPFPTRLLTLGAAFNAWIALLNLIPFGMFDGFKVFLWKKEIWVSAFTMSLILTSVCYYIL